MPTLRRYVPSSDKTGFYIQANVGRGAPVTLQVSQLAGRIFTDNGYGDEDTVPTKLVWAMYDVGLLSIGNSNSRTTKSANVYSAFTSTGASAGLSDVTRRLLLDYLDDYQGAQQGRVRRLRRQLGKTSSKDESRPPLRTEVKTSDLGYGFADSVRHIWRYICAWFERYL